MHWLREHRHTVALIGAAVFVVVGGILARNNTGASELGNIKNVAVEYPYYAPSADTEGVSVKNQRTNPQSAVSDIGSSTASLAVFFDRASTPERPPTTSVTQTATKIVPQTPTKSQSTITNSAYSSFFRTLSNILSPSDTRTPEQKELYNYGNEVGSIVKTFENSHGNLTQVLKTFFDSRVDPSKAAATPEIADAYAQLTRGIPSSAGTTPASATAGVQSIANDYAQLSFAIGSIADVPPQAEILNAKLAKGYGDVAQGMSKLAKTDNNDALLEAINSYNATAEEFIRTYVALADLFSAYGVKFSASDPGSIFSFSMTGGL
ncbi:MAG: hypothetical protein Q7S01_03010 [bacterium]|nr:hypothetical protein [bacterium]